MGREPPDSLAIELSPPTTTPWHGTGSGREIAVLMSGGVDSSTAAARLQEAGWHVLGITMKLPLAEKRRAVPCSAAADAAAVCRHLGIAHYVVDVAAAFERLVIEPFRRAYLDGLTPNPCVVCNARLKFGLAWDFIEEQFGVRRLATGHYARVVRTGGRVCLARGLDDGRDQSYFLYRVPPRRLPSLHLPLGELTKDAARDLARERLLPVAERPDSMELCFAGQGNYRDALGEAASTAPGPILDLAGNVLGQHDGIIHFTLGQRRGLRVALGQPAYVVRICPQDNSVTLGTREQASRRRVAASDANVLLPQVLTRGARLWGKIRSIGEPSSCTVVECAEATLAVDFDAPQFAPAPGQHLVLYDEAGRVVAGGAICPERA